MRKITLSLAVLLFGLGITSCITPRTPSSFSQITDIDRNLFKATNELLNYVSSDRFEPADCAPFLDNVYAEIYTTNVEYFHKNILEQESKNIVRNIWLTRLALREKLKTWGESKQLTAQCIKSVRNGFRAGRVLEDYLLAMHHGWPRINEKKSNKTKALDRFEDFGILNPKYENLELKSGDVLLSRGTAVVSAVIARITEVDTNFSHVAVLYIDEQGKKWVVEAHIEIGTTITPWEKYISDGKARVAIFRNPDERLASAAAKNIYQKAAGYLKRTGKNIPYDFGMNMKSQNEVFCSEIASWAYSLASKGAFQMPLHPSRLMGSPDLMDRLKSNQTDTFAPADMEADTRFEMIGEWRDVVQVGSIHEIDSVMTSMMDWMNAKNYVLRESATTAIMKYVAWTGRKLPLLNEALGLKEKMPTNMAPSVIGTMITLQDVGEILVQDLTAENMKTFARTGFRMTPRQMYLYLEAVRAADQAEWNKTFGRVKFHNRMRP